MRLAYAIFKRIIHFIGLEPNKTGHLEKWVSGLGGLSGILAVAIISQHYFELADATWIVASMGATAVLVFAVPHGPLSQPWAVIGGHVISAFIGVACARWIPSHMLAPAAAVALAIGSMHYLRCIHPPGGATALTAVVAGPNLHALGFSYVLTPVLLNAITMVLIAIVFNYIFPWRRYPIALGTRRKQAESAPQEYADDLNEEDLEKALQVMNSTIDINGQALAHIYRLSRQAKGTRGFDPEHLKPGQCYSNGLYGSDWQVRQIVDMEPSRTSPDDLLIYKIVAGSNRRNSGTASFKDFARWANYEVFLNENSWQRNTPTEPFHPSVQSLKEMTHEQERCNSASA